MTNEEKEEDRGEKEKKKETPQQAWKRAANKLALEG